MYILSNSIMNNIIEDEENISQDSNNTLTSNSDSQENLFYKFS